MNKITSALTLVVLFFGSSFGLPANADPVIETPQAANPIEIVLTSIRHSWTGNNYVDCYSDSAHRERLCMDFTGYTVFNSAGAPLKQIFLRDPQLGELSSNLLGALHNSECSTKLEVERKSGVIVKVKIEGCDPLG